MHAIFNSSRHLHVAAIDTAANKHREDETIDQVIQDLSWMWSDHTSTGTQGVKLDLKMGVLMWMNHPVNAFGVEVIEQRAIDFLQRGMRQFNPPADVVEAIFKALGSVR